MKVYLAAMFSRKDEIAEKTRELQNLGIVVTSTWPWEPSELDSKLYSIHNDSSDQHRMLARKDLYEILNSDAVVLFTHEPTFQFTRGGRMHEAGFAMGVGKTLLVCGPRENIFHYLPEVNQFDTWDQLKETLTKAILV